MHHAHGFRIFLVFRVGESISTDHVLLVNVHRSRQCIMHFRESYNDDILRITMNFPAIPAGTLLHYNYGVLV